MLLCASLLAPSRGSHCHASVSLRSTHGELCAGSDLTGLHIGWCMALLGQSVTASVQRDSARCSHLLQGLEREHDEPLLLSLLRIHLAGGKASPRFSSGAVTRKNGAMPAKPGGALLLGSPAFSG